jgi:hypothetical protein
MTKKHTNARTVGILDRFRTPPEVAFWNWFRQNESRLFDFERDQDRIFRQLASALHDVDPDLTFEFGPIVDGRREFVVSAGGIRGAFPAVEALVEAAPSLARWCITKFRPRRPVSGHLEFAGLRVGAHDVWITCHPDDGRWGLTIHLPGYEPTPDHRYEQIGYLWLDQSLGEYDVETRISFIEFASTDHGATVGDVSLNRLPSIIDGVVSNRERRNTLNR